VLEAGKETKVPKKWNKKARKKREFANFAYMLRNIKTNFIVKTLVNQPLYNLIQFFRIFIRKKKS
jgi:hypothetical protein